ncbi:MAG: hypothetical protein Q4C58_09685 [Eubacteriales bacterium]|nr:hypothetical protein [Eubacteriales bacterium]
MKRKLITTFLCLSLALSGCGSTSETITQVDNSESRSSSIINEEASGTTPTETVVENDIATVEEQVVFDQDGLKITLTGMESDGSLFGSEINFLIENSSEQKMTVQVRDVSVNDYMVDTSMSADTVPGKKNNASMTIMKSSLEECGIEKIAKIDFSFHIFDTESWDTIADTDTISLETSHAATYSQIFDDSGDILYEEDGVKIILKGISDDSIFGPSIKYYIENNSQEKIIVQARDTSVNDFMLSPTMSTEVTAGKKAIGTMTFFSSELEENSISEFETVETSFHIIIGENWSNSRDTDIITLTFN